MIDGFATPVNPRLAPIPRPALGNGLPDPRATVPPGAPVSQPRQDGSGVLGPVLRPPPSTLLGGYAVPGRGAGTPGQEASVAVNVGEGQPKPPGPGWGAIAALLGAVAALIYIVKGA